MQKVLREIKDDMNAEGNDFKDYFDIVNFHHYQGWTTLKQHIRNIKEVIEEELGEGIVKHIPIWASEIGVTTSDLDRGPIILEKRNIIVMDTPSIGKAVRGMENSTSMPRLTVKIYL